MAERLDEIRGRIAAAARRSGRAATAVTLIGVIKGVPVERVRASLELGIAHLGENRVQEGERVRAALAGTTAEWHMIGHLQRNKAARALEAFDRIHSIDTIELAETLSRSAVERSMTRRALVQVNVSGEASKHGVPPERAKALLERAAALPGLAIDGVMSIGLLAGDAEAARRDLAATRALRDRLERETGMRLPELSMGMSADFEIAVEEGSTMVRIGTALFGPRGT